jgi:hypothetical protein
MHYCTMFTQHAHEPNENIAPPPLPKTEPPPLDPDYEVIEFPGQAYTNAPLVTKPAPAGKHPQFHVIDNVLLHIYCLLASCYIRFTLNICCFLSINVTHGRWPCEAEICRRIIENKKWMCYTDGQKNKYSVLLHAKLHTSFETILWMINRKSCPKSSSGYYVGGRDPKSSSGYYVAMLQAGRSRVRDLMKWNFKFT